MDFGSGSGLLAYEMGSAAGETATVRRNPFSKKNHRPIHIWSAGCARGEEAYSLKMIWEKADKKGLNLPRLRLLASDINPEYLKAINEKGYGVIPDRS